jgi:hypothetical protein
VSWWTRGASGPRSSRRGGTRERTGEEPVGAGSASRRLLHQPETVDVPQASQATIMGVSPLLLLTHT